MDERNAVRREPVADCLEILFEVAQSQMFEHPDGHDPAKALFHLAVVTEPEVDPDRQTFGISAPSCIVMLFLRQRDADNAGTVILGQGQRHSSPAAPDIEYTHSRLNCQFASDMFFFVLLRLFQRIGRVFEISLRILSVFVQKKGAWLPRKVIVMCRVAARAFYNVVLSQPSKSDA